MQNNYGIQQWIQSTVLLLQVELDDAIEADQIFDHLMGDEVAPRRDFIEENAVYVQDLDI